MTQTTKPGYVAPASTPAWVWGAHAASTAPNSRGGDIEPETTSRGDASVQARERLRRDETTGGGHGKRGVPTLRDSRPAKPRASMIPFVHVAGNAGRVDGRAVAKRHLAPIASGRGREAAGPHPRRAVPYGGLPADRGVPGRGGRLAGLAGEEVPMRRAPHRRAGPRQRCAALLTGHLHVAGGIGSEGAKGRILVGGHAVPRDAFPSSAACVAFGHLHRAQSLGRDGVRRCVSPIPPSATEAP